VTRPIALACLALGVWMPASAQTLFAPMEPVEKFRYGMRHAVQPTDFIQTAFGSGLAQLRNSPDEWGQGWDAYGERYGSRFAQHLVKRTITTAVQMADGEDPRRIRSTRRGLRNRTVDSVKYSFVAQRDDGTHGFAYSRIIGSYAGGFVSRQWHPERQHTFGARAGAGTLSIGVEVGMSLLNEFLPDVIHKLRRH
jgi:hypothetical protein